MTAPSQQESKPDMSLLIRGSLWIAIGALIAAALVCVVWVLIGDQEGLIGRAFLTILLLAGFAGIAILEASLAPNRPDWLALLSMVSWIIALLVGAVKIWLPEDQRYGYGYFDPAERFWFLILAIGVLQLALLHVRLFTKASQRYVTTFTRVITILTQVFLAGLVGLLVFFLTFPRSFEYADLYWRIVVALAILTAVGTTLIPLLNALFAPKKPKPARPVNAAAPLAPWPMFADGVTPLPALHDGSPDWNAYYTGVPTPQLEWNYDPQTHVGAPQAAMAPSAPPVPPAHVTEQSGADAPVQPTTPAFPPAPPAPPVPPVPPVSTAPPVPPAPSAPAADDTAPEPPR
ncbi:hypothetical protein ACFU0W_05670 [Microbacterium keratanolyticum]|uniref:hypothetical protein n=1 Tax=Microbacterium keratanolyticum TaxID=67574 RepID=UPI00363B3FE3